jgi:hypothetical protein
MVQADKKLADLVEHSDSMIHHEVTPLHCSRIVSFDVKETTANFQPGQPVGEGRPPPTGLVGALQVTALTILSKNRV